MDTTTILAIVAAVVVLGAIVYFVTRTKAERNLPRSPRAAQTKPEPAKSAEPRPKPPTEAEEPGAHVGEEPANKASVRPDPTHEPRTDAQAPAPKVEDKPIDGAQPAGPQDEGPEAQEAARPADAKQTDAERDEEDVEALKKGLASTRGGFIARLARLFGSEKKIDPELLDEIQEVLITADLGVKASEKILTRLKERMDNDQLDDEDAVWAALREEARSILTATGHSLDLTSKPSVLLVVGVNGVGKTTTIGKLASRYRDRGKKVILAAGDTFRAAAVLQLDVWGRRVGCEVVKGKERADPASVIFDAITKAKAEGADLVIADTAGRLHTKTNLMEELKKVVRTAEKALERPVDEILLVLDSTTGQNAIQQAQLFKDAIAVSGVALTKLDGTAKGGVILGIVDEHQLPVHFVGIGERVEDLREFDPATFVQALFSKPSDETLAA